MRQYAQGWQLYFIKLRKRIELTHPKPLMGVFEGAEANSAVVENSSKYNNLRNIFSHTLLSAAVTNLCRK